jgi:hypothetical protein
LVQLFWFNRGLRRRPLILMVAISVLTLGSSGAKSGMVDVSTLTGKFVVGFQGWFMCPHDARGRGGWVHWFTDNRDDPQHAHFDLLPDTSELTPDELYPTGLHTANGHDIRLFSDQNRQTVLRQFEWMQQYRIESVALQRFVVALAPTFPPTDRASIDRVLDNVRASAEQTGRAFFVMYDVAGGDPAVWASTLAEDWRRLIASGLTMSPAYQRHNGRPLLAIAGVGSRDRPGTAEQTLTLLETLRKDSAPIGGVTLLGTVPTGWRTLDGDAKPEPAWARTYRDFDVLSPWTVGRYRDAASFFKFRERWLIPDMAEARRAGIDYMPAIFPGFSWHNLSLSSRHEEKPLNQIPRLGGRFLWMQATENVWAGANMLYGAMFDEVDEGTAMFKIVGDPAELPAAPALLPLSEAGNQLPSDWYLQLSGKITDLLQGRIAANLQFPMQFPGAH